MWKFWARHKVLRRGDEKMVINYNRLTGKIRDAGRYWDGVLVDTTSDIEEIERWFV